MAQFWCCAVRIPPTSNLILPRSLLHHPSSSSPAKDTAIVFDHPTYNPIVIFHPDRPSINSEHSLSICAADSSLSTPYSTLYSSFFLLFDIVISSSSSSRTPITIRHNAPTFSCLGCRVSPSNLATRYTRLSNHECYTPPSPTWTPSDTSTLVWATITDPASNARQHAPATLQLSCPRLVSTLRQHRMQWAEDSGRIDVQTTARTTSRAPTASVLGGMLLAWAIWPSLSSSGSLAPCSCLEIARSSCPSALSALPLLCIPVSVR